MLKKIDNYPGLKLNFNFSPVLLASLQNYANGAMDKHLKILLKPEEEITDDDKIFILNNYFDLNYKNMVLNRPYFTELYNKRASLNELNIDDFTIQEYCDIMANFTISWVDKTFVYEYPELKYLLGKERNYTFGDRKNIYEIQLDIIKRILVEYKKYQDENKVEVSTSPYYHPILPLLIDFKNKEIKDFENLPQNFSIVDDAKLQIELAIQKYNEIFGKKPKGMWLSEQCVCQNSLELLSQQGIKWSVLDEGILSKTIKKEFIRDFEGNLENPFELDIPYKTKSKNSINLLFADSLFANLLNFGYGNYDSKLAANDLYDKIKVIQSKLQNSPNDNHIITIALDGENCWETYQNDGNDFLDCLYELINSDESIKTVCIADYMENNRAQNLDNLKSGSWINRNFDLWIGEATKNVAWLYLSSVIADFEKFKKENNSKEFFEKIQEAKKELLIAQGSDWYWWYGEPNTSKNDEIFDYLFRNHLMNVYKILELEVPQYLEHPLSDNATRPLRNPVGKIYPTLCCDIDDNNDEWKNAGCIFVPDGPTSNVSRLIKNIHFGNDEKNIYFRFEINKNSIKMANDNIENQIAIYFADETNSYYSPIRFVNKNENIYPIIKNRFTREVRFVFDNKKVSRLFFNKACSYGLWAQTKLKGSEIAYNGIIEMKISLEDLKLQRNNISFCIIDATNELINEVYPQDVLINLNID